MSSGYNDIVQMLDYLKLPVMAESLERMINDPSSSNLPVLGILNRLAGAVIGTAGALVIVWTVFVVITLLYVTSVGKELYHMIETDVFLNALYQHNPIMGIATMFR